MTDTPPFAVVAKDGPDQPPVTPELQDLYRGPYPRILDTGCDYAAGASVTACR